MEFVWSDKLGPRRRAAWLLLITPEKVHVFQGKTIPGVVAVVGTDYARHPVLRIGFEELPNHIGIGSVGYCIRSGR